MKSLKKFWQEHSALCLAWITGVLLIYQVLNLHTYVAQVVDHRAILSAVDDDAAWNLRKTVNTRWWKDNGWVLYGPAYFRLNHTIHYFLGRTADDRSETDHEVWEKTAHHVILTTSLLSIVGIALLIACHLLTVWWQRFLFAMGLTSALLSSPAFAQFVLVAHPDALFAFVCVAALALTLRMFIEPAQKMWFQLSAILWGISVSVKMTLGLCVPGFILLFVPPFKKDHFKTGLKYLGIMLAAYFLIGFPQTIVLDRPFRAIAKISSISGAVTVDSVKHWLWLYVTQLGPALLLLWLAAADFDRRKWHVSREARYRLLAFTTLPFFLLLGKRMMVPADHYTMAFVAMALFTAAIFWPRGLTEFLPKTKYPILRGALFLAVVVLTFGVTPKNMQVEMEKMLKCRPEARDTYQRLTELYNAGKNIWIDPYVPYLTNVDQKRMDLSWEKSWAGYKNGNWNVLALNSDFRSRFTGPDVDEYTKADIAGWASAREFYLAFMNGDLAKTPEGHTFRRVYQNACNQEIWLRDEP